MNKATLIKISETKLKANRHVLSKLSLMLKLLPKLHSSIHHFSPAGTCPSHSGSTGFILNHVLLSLQSVVGLNYDLLPVRHDNPNQTPNPLQLTPFNWLQRSSSATPSSLWMSKLLTFSKSNSLQPPASLIIFQSTWPSAGKSSLQSVSAS